MADGTGLVRCVGRDSLTLSSCLVSRMILSQFAKVQLAGTIVLVGSSDAALSELGFFAEVLALWFRSRRNFGFGSFSSSMMLVANLHLLGDCVQ